MFQLEGKGNVWKDYMDRIMNEENYWDHRVEGEAFDRVPRRMLEWAIRKKGIPNVLARSVMSLFEVARTRVRVDSELSEEFEVKVGMHQGSVLSPFLFTFVVDVVTVFARDGVLSELLYADNLVLMSEAID